LNQAAMTSEKIFEIFSGSFSSQVVIRPSCRIVPRKDPSGHPSRILKDLLRCLALLMSQSSLLLDLVKSAL
jgi:hypothetical protein